MSGFASDADDKVSKLPAALGGELAKAPSKLEEEVPEFSIVEEIKNLLAISVPMWLAMTTGIIGNMISMIIVGQCLGETALSGMALGNTFSSCTSMIFVYGMVEAMDVLCSQAYGAKNGRLVGQLLQRAILLVCLLCAPLALAWVFTGPILLMLGQTPILAMEAGVYNAVKTPSLFLGIISSCCVRYLFAQRFTFGVPVISVVTTLMGFAMYWFVVNTLNLGLVGVAMVANVNSGIQLAGFVLLIWYRHHLATNSDGEMLVSWYGVDCPAMWRDWNEFIKLALPATVMSASEILLLEVATIFAGLLPNPVASVAAANIAMNMQTLLYMFPMSMGAASGCRIGNMLGAKQVDHAKKLLRASVLCAVVMWALYACVLVHYNVRYSIGELFLGSSGDSGASAMIAECLGFIVFDNLFDSLKEVQNGVIRGCGKQQVGMLSSVFAYVCIGFPVSLALAFQWHQSWVPGVGGLFCGQMIGSLVHAIINFGITQNIDYDYEVLRVAKIVEAGGKGGGKGKDK